MRRALAVAALLVSTGAAQAAEPQFPKPGTPYSQAKALLLKQGLFIGPEKSGDPDGRFPEIGCWGEGAQRSCQANYVQKQRNGWGWYVVVQVDPANLLVEDARFAYPADGLLSIPPPPAPDIPRLKGEYGAARDRLRALGFKPISRARDRDRVCKDRGCSQYVIWPEITCMGTGINFCTSFWLAPDKRILKVITAGEFPFVHYPEWSSRKEQRQRPYH